MDRGEEAVAAYTAAIQYSPKPNASYHNFRAIAHRYCNRLEAAIADYTAAIEINSRYEVRRVRAWHCGIVRL